MSHVSGVPIDEFEVLYLDCFVDLVEPRTTLYSYHRDSTDIEEWLVNTVIRAERIKRAVEMDYFPRPDNGCLTYNRPCEFMEIWTWNSYVKGKRVEVSVEVGGGS